MIDNASQKIEIFISARNLKDLDYFSKSDPYVKVSFRRDFNVKFYAPIHRTETIANNLNPNFQKSFIVDYIFQSRQDIKFEIMDDDNGNDEFLGSVETTIGALMGARSQTSIHDIKLKQKNAGKLIIRCEKSIDSNIFYQMKFKGVKLMNTDSYFDFWDKSDPFIKIIKIREDNTFLQTFKTPHINNNLNPDWPEFQISSFKTHNQNSTKFKVECWDYDESLVHNFIGECFIDAKQVVQNNMFPLELVLTNPKSSKPGLLVLQRFRMIKKPSFIEYLRGGLQLNMIVAIDFTGSNSNCNPPLHYMDKNKPNQYQVAITAISQILLNYDSDKKIPAFGFGAVPSFGGGGINSHTVSHCFPLSGKPNQIDTYGYEHLMTTYVNSIKHLSFSGPTYFRPIIQQAMMVAQRSLNQGSHVYQILLILTDGQINDMEQTVNLLVNNANLPISIIIVGVGSADFTQMNKLDGDSGLYNSKGQKAARDIVQFVPFREVGLNPDLLSKSLLAELPSQVVQYMKLIGKLPNPPIQSDVNQMISINKPIPQQQIAGMFINNNISTQKQPPKQEESYDYNKDISGMFTNLLEHKPPNQQGHKNPYGKP